MDSGFGEELCNTVYIECERALLLSIISHWFADMYIILESGVRSTKKVLEDY